MARRPAIQCHFAALRCDPDADQPQCCGNPFKMPHFSR
jgi:hypothetical protein